MMLLTKREKSLINRAKSLMEEKLAEYEVLSPAFNSPHAVTEYLKLSLGLEEREHFEVLYLNSQHELLRKERLFSGTVNAASVYPREVVKSVLANNAAVVILAHNHPSGVVEPSASDIAITNKLKNALGLIDVKILDHIIVGKDRTCSFAERGLI